MKKNKDLEKCVYPLNPKDIYLKYCDGDKLTDMEIAYGITHFNELAKLLYISGPVFILAAREAMRIRDRLNEIAAARSNKSKT